MLDEAARNAKKVCPPVFCARADCGAFNVLCPRSGSDRLRCPIRVPRAEPGGFGGAELRFDEQPCTRPGAKPFGDPAAQADASANPKAA